MSTLEPPAEAWGKFMNFLDPDGERAGEKYVAIHNTLIKFFYWRGCVVPEDLADETIKRVIWNLYKGLKLERHKLMAYMRGVARNVHLEGLKEPPMVDAAPEDVGPSVAPVYPGEHTKEEIRMRCLEKCLAQQPPRDREVIIGFFQYEKRKKIENRAEMAKRLGLSRSGLGTMVFHIKKRIKKCAQACIKKYEV